MHQSVLLKSLLKVICRLGGGGGVEGYRRASILWSELFLLHHRRGEVDSDFNKYGHG